MARLHPTQDIRPLADFRANLAAVVRHVQRTKRPVILIQHGRSAAVRMDAAESESPLERADLLEDLRVAETEVAAGRGVSHAKAKAAVLARPGRKVPELDRDEIRQVRVRGLSDHLPH